MMCVSTLVDALRIRKKGGKYQSCFKAVFWSHCPDSNCDDEPELPWWTCNHCWEIRIGNIVMNFLGRLNRWRDQLQIGCTVQRHGRWQTSLQSNQTSSTALTISVGIMDHEGARRKRMGWKILGFFFYRCKARLYTISVGRKYMSLS